MIETICPHCGNKKTFDDSYAGRTFRCPNCKEPVIIQSIAEIVQPKEESHEISFGEQLKKAEIEKKRKEAARKYNEELERLQGQSKSMRFLMVIQVAFFVSVIVAFIWGGGEPTIVSYLFAILPPVLFFVFYKKKKGVDGEIEVLQKKQKEDTTKRKK